MFPECHQTVGFSAVPEFFWEHGRPAEFASMSWQNSPAQRVTSDLHSITNAEDRDAQVEDFWINLRSTFAIYTGRAPGQNQAFRV